MIILRTEYQWMDGFVLRSTGKIVLRDTTLMIVMFVKIKVIGDEFHH